MPRSTALLVVALLAGIGHAEPQGYVEAGGSAGIGVGGFATRLRTGPSAAAGVRWQRWSIGIAAAYSGLDPTYPDQYAYFYLCPRCLGCPCPMQPQLAASRSQLDLQPRAFLLRRGRFEAFAEGRCGATRIVVTGEPRGAFTNFTMWGLHLGASLGGRLHMTRRLAAYLSLGYSFDLVDTPPTFISGDALKTDLMYMSNHANEIVSVVGVAAEL